MFAMRSEAGFLGDSSGVLVEGQAVGARLASASGAVSRASAHALSFEGEWSRKYISLRRGLGGALGTSPFFLSLFKPTDLMTLPSKHLVGICLHDLTLFASRYFVLGGDDGALRVD